MDSTSSLSADFLLLRCGNGLSYEKLESLDELIEQMIFLEGGVGCYLCIMLIIIVDGHAMM
jgi:hypothetical protein